VIESVYLAPVLASLTPGDSALLGPTVNSTSTSDDSDTILAITYIDVSLAPSASLRSSKVSLQNTTAWCGPSWQASRSTADKAARRAAEEGPQDYLEVIDVPDTVADGPTGAGDDQGAVSGKAAGLNAPVNGTAARGKQRFIKRTRKSAMEPRKLSTIGVTDSSSNSERPWLVPVLSTVIPGTFPPFSS
jgi:hypothetical protein